MGKLFIPVKIETTSLQAPNSLENLTVERRFGRTPFYVLYDSETSEYRFVKNTNHHFSGTDTPWMVAAKSGADTVLAAHMGSKPYNGFQQSNISIYEVSENKPILNLIEDYKAGLLNLFKEPEEGSCCSGGNHNHH